MIWTAFVLLALTLGAPLSDAEEDATLNWRDAIRLLAEEKGFAESGAGLLKKYAPDNQAALIEGQRLYAEARAKFDGLIEQLLIDLAEDLDPSQSADMQAALDAAVERRLAFSHHVDASLPRQNGAKNVLFDALAKGAGEIVSSLIDGGIAIWQEFRRASDVRRETIARRVEQQRWRPFAEVDRVDMR